jgi:hypothetical protein
MSYGLSVKELVEYGLGFPPQQANWLDRCPPDRLFKALAKRTRVSVERVRRTTLVAVLPILIGLFDSSIFGDNSVLLAPTKQRQRSLSHWSSWLRNEWRDGLTACRSCLASYPNAGILLPWRLSIMHSCPVHGRMLEPARIDNDSVYWLTDGAEEVPKLIRALEARTWTALTSGYLELPGGKIDVRLWFSLLRIIQDELTRPIWGGSLSAIKRASVWAAIDSCPQVGTIPWKSNPERIRCALIATAIDMIEQGRITAEGGSARLFYSK